MTNLKSLYLLTDIPIPENSHLFNNDNFTYLTNLQILHASIWCPFIHFESLKLFVHLKELKITSQFSLSLSTIESRLGKNLSLLDHLKSLEALHLHFSPDLNIQETQQRYPRILFRWYYTSTFRCYYEGEFEGNIRSGKGVFVGENGDKYVGEFRADVREGKGRTSYVNGSVYEGDYKNSLMDGQGILLLPYGDRYVGEFKRGTIEGRGTYYYPDGNVYEGELVDGQFQGKGVMKYHLSGNRYEGEFSNDQRNGSGIMFYPNGNRFEGRFLNDLRVGTGVFYFSNGDQVELNEGDGVYITFDGNLKVDKAS